MPSFGADLPDRLLACRARDLDVALHLCRHALPSIADGFGRLRPIVASACSPCDGANRTRCVAGPRSTSVFHQVRLLQMRHGRERNRTGAEGTCEGRRNAGTALLFRAHPEFHHDRLRDRHRAAPDRQPHGGQAGLSLVARLARRRACPGLERHQAHRRHVAQGGARAGARRRAARPRLRLRLARRRAFPRPQPQFLDRRARPPEDRHRRARHRRLGAGRCRRAGRPPLRHPLGIAARLLGAVSGGARSMPTSSRWTAIATPAPAAPPRST